MIPKFGVIRGNAELVDTQNKGTTTLLTVQATAISKRAAKRGAKLEAMSLIPLTDQTVVNSTQLRGTGRNSKWLFTISDE
jgi:hypothetical protein